MRLNAEERSYTKLVPATLSGKARVNDYDRKTKQHEGSMQRIVSELKEFLAEQSTHKAAAQIFQKIEVVRTCFLDTLSAKVRDRVVNGSVFRCCNMLLLRFEVHGQMFWKTKKSEKSSIFLSIYFSLRLGNPRHDEPI